MVGPADDLPLPRFQRPWNVTFFNGTEFVNIIQIPTSQNDKNARRLCQKRGDEFTDQVRVCRSSVHVVYMQLMMFSENAIDVTATRQILRRRSRHSNRYVINFVIRVTVQ